MTDNRTASLAATRGLRVGAGPCTPGEDNQSPVLLGQRIRVLGAVAPQRRLLRDPTPHGRPRKAVTADIDPVFVSHMEVLDALLASAHERLLYRLSRLRMRRGQAHRFIVAAAGRLLRAAQLSGATYGRSMVPALLDDVPLDELAARTRMTVELAMGGLQVVLPELEKALLRLRR